MLGKRKALSLAPPAKRKKSTTAIEEINFDFTAREDYLTGFHKRKLQRIKHAQEEAAKQEREERLVARRNIREGRKADLEKHVDEVNALVQKARDGEGLSGSDEAKDEGEGWEGLGEPPPIDEEAEYIDEDRHTTVTIEAVDVTKEGIYKVVDEASDEEVVVAEGEEKAIQTDRVNIQGQSKRAWTKERPSDPKKKKKKFRYESKAERKVTRYKERSGNRAKAKARRE